MSLQVLPGLAGQAHRQAGRQGAQNLTPQNHVLYPKSCFPKGCVCVCVTVLGKQTLATWLWGSPCPGRAEGSPGAQVLGARLLCPLFLIIQHESQEERGRVS